MILNNDKILNDLLNENRILVDSQIKKNKLTFIGLIFLTFIVGSFLFVINNNLI